MLLFDTRLDFANEFFCCFCLLCFKFSYKGFVSSFFNIPICLLVQLNINSMFLPSLSIDNFKVPGHPSFVTELFENSIELLVKIFLFVNFYFHKQV